MIQQMAFDNICHEHVYYYSLSSLTKLFEAHDFTVVDANLNDCNGGSVRLYLTKKTSNQEFFGTKQFIQVCSFRKNAILSLEEKIDISNVDIWKKFSYDLGKLKQQVLDFFKQAKKENKVVYGYGASTKGNTLFQYFLDHDTFLTFSPCVDFPSCLSSAPPPSPHLLTPSCRRFQPHEPRAQTVAPGARSTRRPGPG
jgi:hypothetical protein